jgi:crotonobetainyl-CoA:carnitine CoA-transferase CaiB-like acyl-CoA transferase
MLQAASAWLITTLPLLDFDCDPSEVTRCGNEHRKFIPVNAYPTEDGFVFIAVGNDLQWERLTAMSGFESLGREERKTNAGRHRERAAIHQELAAAIRKRTSAALMQDLVSAGIPHAPINTVSQVREMDAIASKLTTTRTPDGKVIHLPPPAVDLEGAVTEFSFAPRYSEHTESILKESGSTEEEIAALHEKGIIP